MTHFLLVIFIFAILKSAFSGANGSKEIGPEDLLQVNGTHLTNRRGEVVPLRGVNLGGWLIQEKWMSPMDSCDRDGCNVLGCPRLESRLYCKAPDEFSLEQVMTEKFGAERTDQLLDVYRDAWINMTEDLDNIQALGMNLIRVPLYYRNFMDDNGNLKRAAAQKMFDRLDTLVTECAKRGIYIVLDLHGAAGCQNIFDNCGKINEKPQLWSSGEYQAATVQLWKELAKHFKDSPVIAGYDLLNEPLEVKKETKNEFFDRLYKEIRSVDSEHAIIMEAPYELTSLDKPADRGWTNVIYSLHIYDISHWYNRERQEKLVDYYLNQIEQFLNNSNVPPVYVGEFCLFKETDLWQKFLDKLNQLDVSWTHWSYKMIPDDFGQFNWALFVNNSNPLPDWDSDNADQIEEKWKKFDTKHFEPNKEFQTLISKCASGDCVHGANASSAQFVLSLFAILLSLAGVLLLTVFAN